jgi:hypothetical protein
MAEALCICRRFRSRAVIGFELLLLDTLDFGTLLEEEVVVAVLADRRRVLVEGVLLETPAGGCGTPSSVLTSICCERGMGRGGGCGETGDIGPGVFW